MEYIESRAGFGIHKPRDTSVLDGLRQHAGYGTGHTRNRSEKNQTAGIHAVRNGGIAEGDHPLCEVRESEREGFRTELLAGRGSGEAGPVHQLHTGTARLQHPVENVPQWYDRASRAVSESLYHESESYRGVIYAPITLPNDKIRNFCLHYCLSQLPDLSFRTANHNFSISMELNCKIHRLSNKFP